MDLKVLSEIPPWEWPEDTDQVLLEALSGDNAGDADRVIAAELAGSTTVINDDLVEALLSILQNGAESEDLRITAAISLGPVLEQTDCDGFDDPEDVLISENAFHRIQESLRKLYMDASVPKNVRRRVLEASVRAPRQWHQGAVEAAYSSNDGDWKLTAVFSMRWIRGFDKEILKALESDNPDIHYEAVCAAGVWGVDGAWPQIAQLVASPDTEKNLLLAAIEAAAGIRPQEADLILEDLTLSDDEEIVEAAYDAMAMANGSLYHESDEFDDFDEDDEDDEDGYVH